MIILRECTKADITDLQRISCDIFRDTFASTNTEENMNAFLEEAYNRIRLEKELANEASMFYFAYQEGNLAGYLKLNDLDAQTDIHDPLALELERIYVLKEFQGKGVGRYFMKKAIEEAEKRRKTYIWLGVWEHNEKAISFYTKCGFYKTGNHSFTVGDDVQNDFLMRKDLS